jgi:hypothetical protein
VRLLGFTIAGAVLAGFAVSPPVAAQATVWQVGADVAVSHLSGGARGTSAGEEVTVRPYRPTLYGLRAERMGERVGYGLALRYANPAMAFGDADVTIVDSDLAFTLYEIAPEVLYRIAGSDGAGPSLRGTVGPVLDIWTWSVTDTETRLGARAGVGAVLPIGRRLAATIGAAATLSGSMFAEADLGDEFERESVVRTEIGLGVQYRLR